MGDGMRRSISAVMLALAASILSALGPAAGAATPARSSAGPNSPGSFGVRLVDVAASEAGNPRALHYIVDYLSVGSVIHRQILIVNDEPHKASFSVYPDAAQIVDGVFLGGTGATRSELTNWISVQHPTVTLAAWKSAPDKITIRVPRGATRGEHYGVIWVQQAARPSNKSGFVLTEVSRVGVRVYLAVGRGGAPPTSFGIASIAARRTASGQPYIVARVRNTGGRAIDLNGSVRLANGPGDSSSGPFYGQKIVTLAPGQSWNVTFPLPESQPAGSWRATVTLVSGLTVVTGTATVRIAAVAAAQAGLSRMPWMRIALGALVLMLVLALVAGLYVRGRRRRHVPAW
jgi:hypothetical protein